MAAVADALDHCVRTVQRATDDHGVTFFETDIDRDGGKIMLVAGAPRSDGHDEERMLRTVAPSGRLAGFAEMTGSRCHCASGSTGATCSPGEFGPDLPPDVLVKGDAMNLAARVMGKAAPARSSRPPPPWSAHPPVRDRAAGALPGQGQVDAVHASK